MERDTNYKEQKEKVRGEISKQILYSCSSLGRDGVLIDGQGREVKILTGCE